jgi:hypothetical protein
MTTMQAVLDGILPDLIEHGSSSSSYASTPTTMNPLTKDQELAVAELIEQLWRSKEKSDHNTKHLHELVPPYVLARLIPTWESQWRVVYYALIELFRRRKEKKVDDLELVKKGAFVKETLRLYAPVKSVKRMSSDGREEVFPIAPLMRDSHAWGDDALVFDPNRTFTSEQEIKLKKVFGMGELKCVAGLDFVQQFCGLIIVKVAEHFDVVEGDEWDSLPSPLVNERGKYEGLVIARVNGN